MHQMHQSSVSSHPEYLGAGLFQVPFEEQKHQLTNLGFRTELAEVKLETVLGFGLETLGVLTLELCY